MPSRHTVPVMVKLRFDEIVGLIETVCLPHLTQVRHGRARAGGSPRAETADALAPQPLPHMGVWHHRHDRHCQLSVRSYAGAACAWQRSVRIFRCQPERGCRQVAGNHAGLRYRSLDPRWSLPSRLADNPLVWMVSVNGVIVDMRMMPRNLQEQAYELGLIPFVPGARGEIDGPS